MTVNASQCSDWSTPVHVVSRQEQTVNNFSKSKIHSNKVFPADDYPNKSKNKQKTKVFRSKLKQWWSSVSPFYKGILLGAVVGSVILAIILPLWLTAANRKTTTTKTPVGNVTLRWNTTGITIGGVMNQKGTDANLLDWPMGLAIDSLNTLYVGDYINNRVQKFLFGNLNATTVAGQENGVQNRTPSTLNYPAGVLVDSNDNLYVADSGNSRVQLWLNAATSGSTVAGNGTAGSLNNELNTTYGVALDSSTNTLYVADAGNQRIMAYSSGASSGTLVAGGNGVGLNNTQLYNVSSIYFDSPSNSLIIANRYAHNIVRWTLGSSQWTLIAGSTNGSRGSSSILLNTPFGVTLDPMGNVYVSDTSNNRIQFFSAGQSTGITIAGTGVRGNDSNLLWAPYAIVLDNQLNLYVADRNNDRVQKYLRY